MFFYNMDADEIKSFLEKTFYKVLNTQECHHDFQYSDGLNIDTVIFDPHGHCEPGGLYFTDAQNIFQFLEYGDHIREVIIPGEAQIYKDISSEKWKADRIILGKRLEITDKGLEILVEQGLDITDNKHWYLVEAAFGGHLDIIKTLLNRGANIHTDHDEAIQTAAYEGHLDIVKYLVEQGADFHTLKEYPIQKAASRGHLDIVKYLVKQGADIHADNDYALKTARRNDQTEVIEYIKSLP